MKKNPVWSLNESFFGTPFEKSKTPELQWGLALSSPINKMPVTIEVYMVDIKLNINIENGINSFLDEDHLSWIADTHHTMIFETLAGDYHDLIARMMSGQLEVSVFQAYIVRLNRAYIHALQYFGC